MHHSPCQTPYTALGSLLSVALSSDMVKSNFNDTIHIKESQCTVTPSTLFSFKRRGCSVSNGQGVQFDRRIHKARDSISNQIEKVEVTV